MLKPTKTYKMSSTTKRMLASIIDPHERGIQKRLMIQAELHAAIAPRREKKNPRQGLIDLPSTDTE
jgi:hypothetical protein